jgi:hypothetical protein
MSDDQGRRFLGELYPLLRGNRDALSLCADLLYVGHLWDDLIDKDKPLTDEQINSGFSAMVAKIPMNPFFQEHVRELGPLLMSVILQWKDANKLEADGSPHERAMAYMLRNALLQVMAFCIWLIGGDGWYEEAGDKFQRLCAAELGEAFGAFMEEMGYA